MVILSSDNLTYELLNEAYFLFLINLITRSKKIYCNGRSFNNCGTMPRRDFQKMNVVNNVDKTILTY